MIKRKFRVLITPVLLLGLAACNNDTDTAMDVQNRDKTIQPSIETMLMITI